VKLEGKLFRANLMIDMTTVEKPDIQDQFVRQLEQCLVELCRNMDAPIPLWLEKNTHEFARFHQTIFFSEQFTERINFDRMQIRWLK